MSKLLKQGVWLTAILFLLCQNAIADRSVVLPASYSQLSQEEIETALSDFFSKRCNLPSEYIGSEFNKQGEKYSLQFGLFGYGCIPNAGSMPVWEAYFQLHGSDHYALLDSAGEILFWQSHGTKHFKDEPDVWESAISATPLVTDATEAQILSDVKKRLNEATTYSEAEIEAFEYQIRFVYELHFNDGKIPVWLTYVYDDDVLIFKQANGYDGSLMCLSTPEADFGEYKTMLPSFGDVTGFQYSIWYENTMTFEEKVAQAERWRPIVEQWLIDYPYSIDSLGLAYDVTIRQTFGIPDDHAISQQEAESIAIAYAPHLGLSERFLELRKCRANYLITDPENPVWRILVKTPSISLEEKQMYRGVDESVFKKYVVEIHAYTGNVMFATIIDADTPAYMWQY